MFTPSAKYNIDELVNGLDITKLGDLSYIAETAERDEDMIKFVKRLIVLTVQNGQDIDIDQRNHFSIAYKNVIGRKRVVWKSLLGDFNDEDKRLLNKYKYILENELETLCLEVLELLTTYLYKIVKGNANESEVFYLKMLGDYNRYLCDFCIENESFKKSANQYYQKAMEIAKTCLNEQHPTRLALSLNFSAFCYEILFEKEKACNLAKEAFDDALEEMERDWDTYYKDSGIILQIMRDNLTEWTSTETIKADKKTLISSLNVQNKGDQDDEMDELLVFGYIRNIFPDDPAPAPIKYLCFQFCLIKPPLSISKLLYKNMYSISQSMLLNLYKLSKEAGASQEMHDLIYLLMDKKYCCPKDDIIPNNVMIKMFSESYTNYVIPLVQAITNAVNIVSDPTDSDIKPYFVALTKKVQNICNDTLDILNNYMFTCIHSKHDNDDAKNERDFECESIYYETCIECYKHLQDITDINDEQYIYYQTKATEFYENCVKSLKQNYPILHPTRLRMILNFGKHYYERLGDHEKGFKLLKQAYDEAIDHSDVFNDKCYEDTNDIIQSMKQNLECWSDKK